MPKTNKYNISAKEDFQDESILDDNQVNRAAITLITQNNTAKDGSDAVIALNKSVYIDLQAIVNKVDQVETVNNTQDGTITGIATSLASAVASIQAISNTLATTAKEWDVSTGAYPVSPSDEDIFIANGDVTIGSDLYKKGDIIQYSADTTQYTLIGGPTFTANALSVSNAALQTQILSLVQQGFDNLSSSISGASKRQRFGANGDLMTSVEPGKYTCLFGTSPILPELNTTTAPSLVGKEFDFDPIMSYYPSGMALKTDSTSTEPGNPITTIDLQDENSNPIVVNGRVIVYAYYKTAIFNDISGQMEYSNPAYRIMR